MTLAVCATVALTVLRQLSLVDHFGQQYAGKEAGLRLQQLSWQMRDSLNRVVHKAVGDVRKAATLLPVLQQPFALKTATVSVGAGIGVAVHLPDDPVDVDGLLARADHAMYGAKRKGKNCVAMAPAAGAGEAVGNFAA